MTTSSKKVRIGYTQAWISILGNILLFVIKYWAGVVSYSVGLIADAWHTLTDTFSSVIVIAGIRLSVKKPDKKHPFGYGRGEQLAAVFIGVLLAIVAIELIHKSILKINTKTGAQFGTLAIIVTVISILTKEAMAQYAFWCYRRTGYKTLRADGWHHRSDSLSSVVILIGIFLKPYIWWIDSLLGILVSLMLLYAAFDIIRDTIKKLLGEEAPEELQSATRHIIGEITSVNLEPHHFHLHNYGEHKELTFHIRLPNSMKIGDAHEIATRIEAEILLRMDIDATIHIEPLDYKHFVVSD